MSEAYAARAERRSQLQCVAVVRQRPEHEKNARMMYRAAWLVGFAWSCAGPGPAAFRDPSHEGASAPRFVAQPGDIAFADVAVVSMTRDGALAHHTVVIRGERIAAVEPSGQVVLPAGVTVIDGGGRWLMPGLADMHVHTWHDDDLMMFVAAGVTTIRNMWGIEQHLAWRSQIARGERLGPTIVTAGALIDGDPPEWPGSVVLSSAADADALVVAQKAAGYEALKPVSLLSREAYEALAAAGARHGMALWGHVPLAVGLEGALAAQQRSIEHLDQWLVALVPPGVSLPPEDGSLARQRAVLAALDASRLPALIARTIAAGTWNCPTLITWERLAALDDVAALRRRVAWLDQVPAAVRAGWVPERYVPWFTAEDFATIRASNAQHARIAATLVAAGAPILVGTDAGAAFVVPGASLHDEIELLVAAGVPRPRALRAATADAWRYLGRPREAGIVEPGARADLLLVGSDPLRGPLPLVPDGVMVRGHWLPRVELDGMLADIAERVARPIDHWDGAPPLATGGNELSRARYDKAIGGTSVAQERLVVSAVRGKRVVAGQIAELDSGNETSYRFGPDTAEISSTHHTMNLALAGKVTAGKLVVTGTDLSGRPVSLSAGLPAGAFLSAPAMAGANQLAERLAGLKPGGKRELAALEIAYFPSIAIVPARYQIERKPDVDGHRVFAVTATRNGARATSELAVDGAIVARRTAGTEVTARVPAPSAPGR
jgi:imidazolonepropionase-like amidohydrolase